MKKQIVLLFLIASCHVFSQEKPSYKELDSLILKGRYKVALKKLDKLEDSFRKQNTIASIYYQLDKTNEAIQYYQKALAIEDNLSLIHI